MSPALIDLAFDTGGQTSGLFSVDKYQTDGKMLGLGEGNHSMKTTTTANEAAEYLLWLAAHEREEDPDYFTPLKLQKILYYLQGWTLAEWGRPFFREEIQAWQHGPVVRDVYDRYKDHEKAPITRDLGTPPPPGLTPDERAMVRSVWNAYKQYSGWTLSDMTHNEPAYREAYSPHDAQGRCEKVIRQAAMVRDFTRPEKSALARMSARRDKLRAFATANTRALTGRDAI